MFNGCDTPLGVPWEFDLFDLIRCLRSHLRHNAITFRSKTDQLTLLDVIQKDNYVNASTDHLMEPPNWDQPRF